MILLDTNIVSELVKDRPAVEVVGWLSRVGGDDLCTTTLTMFESQRGGSALPDGARRRALEERLSRFFSELLAGRVFPFDVAAATEAARLDSVRRLAGTPKGEIDTLIAGVALSRRAAIATRNVRHFDDLSVPLINPWTA